METEHGKEKSMSFRLKILMKFVPLPDYKKIKKALFIGPHPDDIEIGAGATVKKLINQGTEVFFLIATDGGAGSKDPEMTAEKLPLIRREEAIASGKFLGVKEIEILDFPDGGVYEVEDLTTEIIKRIIKISPDAVFAPDPLLPTETHPDHLKTAEAARRSIPLAQFPLSVKRRGIELEKDTVLPANISLLYYYTARPNLYIPVSKAELEAKFAAIKLHKSQMDESFNGIFFYLRNKAKSFGWKARARYGEAFYALSPVHQHCFTENI